MEGLGGRAAARPTAGIRQERAGAAYWWDDGDRQGRLNAVHGLPRAREEEQGGRVVLGVPPIMALGAQGVPPLVYHRHITGSRQWV